MDLYYVPGSPPCRGVLLAGKALGVDFNLKLTNLMAGEHMTPEFLALNPQHTLPTLVDNGFKLWESRPIMIYLAEKYGKDDSLYPKDPQARAVVNQRLFFDMGTLMAKYAEYYYPQYFAKAPADAEKLKACETAMGFLNTFLEGSEYAAGKNLTLADCSLMATVSTYEVSGFDFSKFPNVSRWMAKCKSTMPGYQVNQDGVDDFKAKFVPK